MSDVGEDDGKESDWIREVSDDSDTEIPGGLSRKYYSQYIAGAERQAEQDEEGDPLQWTGSDTGLKKQDSPIISNMDHYHVGPEFEENCQPWTSGEPGPGSQGAHRSSSEVDHNANHLVNIDYRGGEAFCDSDILSSDQSLSDFEQAEHRWSSSESSRKSDAGHQRIVQRNERGVPRSGLPVFSRSAETARAHMDQKQPAQRPDRFYARRLEIRRTRAPSDQCIGEKKVGGGLVNRRYQIKIKGSKSCTTECEVLRPGSEKLYPCPDKTRFTNLYEEILRSDECSFFTDEDDNPEEDYSDFADDDVSEITGLDTSDSKSERVTASRISARTESPGESLRDGAVPGGKDNSSPVVELSPLRIDEPHLSPILPVSAPFIEKFQAKTDAGDSNDDTRDNNTDHRNVTTIKTKAMFLNQTLDDKTEATCLNQTLDDKIEAMCLNQTLDDKIEAMCLNQTLDDKIEAMCLNQTLDDKIEATCFNQTLDDKTEAMYLNQTLDDKTEALCTQETVLNECNENQASVLTCLENNGTFNFLNQVLVNAYLQMSKDPEDSSEIQSVKTNVCINGLEVQCIESVKTNVCIKRSEVQYFPHQDSSFSNSYKMEGDSQFDLSENPAQNEPTITKEMNCEDGQLTHFTVECIQKEVQELDHNMADKVDETAEVGEVTGPDVKQGDSTAVHGSSNSAELPSTDAGEGSNDMIGDALAQNEDAASCSDGAAHNPTTTPFPRQYYMSFLTVLRNKKLVNKKVRRPPQKFFRLLQAKSETMNVSEKDPGAADGREASGLKERSVKIQARHFPKGREVPPGWKPGQYTTSSALSGSGAAPVVEHAAKKKNKKVCAGKGKQHAKGFNNNKKRHVSSEASVQEVESEESFPSRNRRVSYSSESSESTESKHTLGYGERYNPHSEDYSETEQKGGGGRSSCKKSFGQEFESKRQYYEKLTINKRKTSKEDEPGKVELTSQVKFLKTIDEFCSAEDNDNMDYDSYEDTYNGPGEQQAMDSVEYHISLAKYYSGRASNLLAIKSNPPGEPSASCSGVRIRRAANSVPSAIDNERLKSLSVEESNKAQREKVGMWSLNTLYAHKIGISEVPRESSVSLVAPYAEGKEEPVEVSQPVVRKAKTKHGRKRPLDRYRELKLAKFRSVKTSHLEKLAVFESERKVTYLDLLKTGYSTKMSRPMKEQDERKDTASVQRSKSCDNPGGKTLQGQIRVDVSPPIDQENPRRLKLVRFNEPKPLDEDKPSELVDRSEEDTWYYSVNAMLLRANQAMEQQKMAISENNHHFPRPDSAKVVPPVIKPKSSSFLSELLEQDREEQKKVKQSQQKSKRTETSRAAEDERKRSVDNNGNAADNKSSHGHTMPAGPSDYKEVKPSCAFTNILPSMNLAPNEAPPESPKHSAGILKIKTSASSRKPKDCHPRREQKVFPSDCPASLYFSSNSSQPTVPPKKLLPLRYSAPVDPSTHMDSTWTPVRILKQSMLQRGSSDIQDSPSISIGEKQVIAKPATTTAGGVMSGLRYNRTDHRVSTIVQMFSDFNTNTNNNNNNNNNNNKNEYFVDSDGYSQESYVDPENSLEDVESNDEEDYPTVLPHNGPPRRSFNLQIIQEEPQYGSSSCYTSSQLELESGSSTNSSLSHGLQCGAEANEGLRSGGYDSQSASEECLNESVENDLYLTYGVSNDPDALCMQGVMGILGKRHGGAYSQRHLLPYDGHFTSDGCSSELELQLSTQKDSTDNGLNIDGLDRREFITAAIECSPGQAGSRCILRKGEMIEYCQPDGSSLTISDQQHDVSSPDRSYSGVWDPNYPEEVLVERPVSVDSSNVQHGNDQVEDAVRLIDNWSVSKADQVDYDELITPRAENSNYSKPVRWDHQHVPSSVESSNYSKSQKESESCFPGIRPAIKESSRAPKNSATNTSKIVPATNTSKIVPATNTSKIVPATNTSKIVSPKKQGTKQTLKLHLYQLQVSDSTITKESSASKGMSGVAVEQCKRDAPRAVEEKAGAARNRLDETESINGSFNCIISHVEQEQRATAQQEFNWGELKVPPPYPDRGDQKGDRAAARVDETNVRYNYSNYSTPTQWRETLTGSDQFLSTPEHYRSQPGARSSAPISQDSHTTEIIGETYPGAFDQDATMRLRDSRIELATASQVSDLAGDEFTAGHEKVRGGRAQDERGGRKHTHRSKLALTVIDSSCLVYKRVNLHTPRQCGALQTCHLYQDRQYLKNLRGSDLLRTVVQDNQRLWPSLQSLVRVVTFLPAFQIRSLHPPEMIPVVIQINRCGKETTDDAETSDGAKYLPAFSVRDKGNLLQSLFSVYYLRPGLYSVHCTSDGEEKVLLAPYSQNVLTPCRLSMYRAGTKITLDTGKDMYLFGDEASTYDLALGRIVETYDKAKAEKDAGVYFKLTCGWAPKYVVIGETVLEALNSFCLNCIRERRGAVRDETDARSEGSTDTRVTQDYRMYHNFCDRCGGCVAALPLMKSRECEVVAQLNRWSVDHSGKALPLNTKPAAVKKVSTDPTLPRIPPRRFYKARSRAEEMCGRGQRRQWMSLSLPSVVASNAAVARLQRCGVPPSKPTHSVSSPNMYTEEWWWKEIQQIRQDEMDSLKKDSVRGHSSDVELVSYNDEARSKRKQRLQEIKEELRAQRQSPVSELKDILAEERVPPPSLVEEFASIDNISPNDIILTGSPARSDLDLHSVKSVNVIDQDESVFTKAVPVPPSINAQEGSPGAAKRSYYFGDIGSETKANLVRQYVAPPSRLSSEVRANKFAATKYAYLRRPLRLPPVNAESKRCSINRKQQMSSTFRPSRMNRAQKGKSKKKVNKSTSLSSADSDLSDKTSSSSSISSSSVSDYDSSSGDTDFFTKYKKMGGPTSIEDIFTRTLPKLRAERLSVSHPWGRGARNAYGEDDDDMESWVDRLKTPGDDDERGDSTEVQSGHSHVSARSEYDMCDDADEMRQMWKLCFPEVNFFERRKKSKRLKKARQLVV